ncbi:MAG: hypothetical protein HDS91_04785 [Bacteroidales bacterium]|nr:hypothetical protein [Bacteroidales bacterium]
MKRSATLLMAMAALSLTASAQSAIDAYTLSRSDLRGTARFMSMGGAFTALGGDISTLTQNPGGLGIYRSSEINATLDLNFQSSKTATPSADIKNTQTKVACNEFGYVGSFYTGNEVMPYLNVGFSYGRAASFDRAYKASFGQLQGSLSNYIAAMTSMQPSGASGYSPEDLTDAYTDYNPYTDSKAPWLSILGYNAFMINPVTGNANYSGLWQNGTSGSGAVDVVEKGYIDEYNIDLGGNLYNTVYWGLGVGITDLSYTSSKYYEEDFNNAAIAKGPDVDGTTTGNGGFGLDNYKHMWGNGFNFKIGLIVKPINELRIGLAVHTPTYYNLSIQNWAGVDYGYSTVGSGETQTNRSFYETVDWKLRTPWRLMAGVAGVIGSKGIVSLDYEYRPNQSINMRDYNGYEMTALNGDIKSYYKATNIIRLGLEYRISPMFSARAGYVYESQPVTTEFSHNELPVYTSGYYDYGTDPSYTVDKTRQYFTLGLGVRGKSCYFDVAYVGMKNDSEFHAYTPNSITAAAPSASIKNFDNHLVMTLGFRF